MRPDAKTLNQIVRYDQTTGKLFWLHRADQRPQWNGRHAGKEAFTATDRHGYYVGSINGHSLYAHLVIYALMTGNWAVDEVDHIDRNHQNNVWRNLRPATRQEQTRNTSSRRGSSSQSLGVSKFRDKWQAGIKVNGKRKHLGVFKTKEEAASVYNEASRSIFGAFSPQLK